MQHTIDPITSIKKRRKSSLLWPSLEAARVRQRGHDVILFEASNDLGGQVLLAAQATWRRLETYCRLAGSTSLKQENVDVRFNVFAGAEDVLEETPDIVVVATGGFPRMLGKEENEEEFCKGFHGTAIYAAFGRLVWGNQHPTRKLGTSLR